MWSQDDDKPFRITVCLPLIVVACLFPSRRRLVCGVTGVFARRAKALGGFAVAGHALRLRAWAETKLSAQPAGGGRGGTGRAKKQATLGDSVVKQAGSPRGWRLVLHRGGRHEEVEGRLQIHGGRRVGGHGKGRGGVQSALGSWTGSQSGAARERPGARVVGNFTPTWALSGSTKVGPRTTTARAQLARLVTGRPLPNHAEGGITLETRSHSRALPPPLHIMDAEGNTI